MSIQARLKELKINLPEAPHPVANFRPFRQTENLIFISGQGPVLENQPVYQGKLGREISRDEGYQAARLCALNLLSQLKAAVGNLDRIEKVISVRGFVASTDEFYEQPAVINGCSDLIVEIFGELGKHSRCALGVNVLPGNIPVEIEMLVEIKHNQ